MFCGGIDMVVTNDTNMVFDGVFHGMESKLNQYDYEFLVAKGDHNKPVIAIHPKPRYFYTPSVIVQSMTENDSSGMWWTFDVRIQFPELWEMHGVTNTPDGIEYQMRSWIELAKIVSSLSHIKIPYTE